MTFHCIAVYQCMPVFHNICYLHPNLAKTHDSTSQNVAVCKGETKFYIAIDMYLHINPCPINVRAYENKTKHMLN